MNEGVDGLVMLGHQPGTNNYEAGEDNEVFDPFSRSKAQRLEWRDAKFERDGQQPRDAFFGEGVHY